MIWWRLLLVIIIYAVLETESRPYSDTSRNILQLSGSVNMLQCTHRHVLSSSVCQTGMMSVKGFPYPSTSFWSLGVPVCALRHSPKAPHGAPVNPCQVGFPFIKQAEAFLHSQAGTLKHAGTQVLCNSPLYWTTAQGHEQLTAQGHEQLPSTQDMSEIHPGSSQWCQ